MNKALKNKVKTIAVSGGFDPIHIGHVRLFKAAKKLVGKEGKLFVILNNDNWLRYKKGFVFMPQEQRKEIIESIKYVDKVIYTDHRPNTKDISVSKEILKLKPDIFGKGGDRKPVGVPIPGSEVDICNKIGCKVVYDLGVGGKVESSSWLLDKFYQSRLKSKKSK